MVDSEPNRADRTSGAHDADVPLEVPAWLRALLAPWRVEEAAVGPTGVALTLAVRAGRVTVRVGSRGVDAVAPAVGEGAARAVATAVGERLRRRSAASTLWWARARALSAALAGPAPAAPVDATGALLTLYRAWPPEREARDAPVDALPPEVEAACATGGPVARAALALHRFAREDVLGGLEAWAALARDGAPRSGLLGLVDAVAHGLLGRRREAREALDAVAAEARGPDAWLTVARGYEAADERDAALAAYERVVALRGDAWDHVRLIRAGGAAGPRAAALALPPEAPADQQASFTRALLRALEGVGRYDDALAALDAALARAPEHHGGGEDPWPALALRSAELHLYRGETALACARVDQAERRALAPSDALRARVVRGASAVLEGRPEAALALLEAERADVSAGGAELERALWLAEAHLALGEPDAALVWIDRHIARENSVVAFLMKLLAVLRRGGPGEEPEELERPTFLDGLVRDVLPSLRPPDEVARAARTPSALARLVREVLDELGGCRAPRPVRCVRGPDGTRRLEALRARPTGREAAVANLLRLRTAPPDAVLAGFDEVAAAYPSSPHPYTYRGELLLWLGRYEDALASFDAADARAPTRWSAIGRAAAHELLGDAECADRWIARCAAQWGDVPSATTHVYRGERHRRRGAWADARRDLELALAHKPRRVGARIDLALVCRATGDTAGFAAHVERLRADAPAQLWEAGARRGRPVDEATLLAALDRMVGNRSSFLHTIVDPAGVFRVLPDPRIWTTYARRCLPTAREAIARALGACWMADPPR